MMVALVSCWKVRKASPSAMPVASEICVSVTCKYNFDSWEHLLNDCPKVTPVLSPTVVSLIRRSKS
eukprot:CAMPEP_0204406952 /NCGR_PEP_ID=MMETSP0470-20130426/8414_1 /ASSEMBLY_ACC=CAM_ASM_000385 /TAXON_ID=2969 /ORGANISM="Oxyrrhis marina" /LENGTH=65 /DNA_ID=CAMNT_0051402569 /DNA_START=46 /DNA_END=243 /DNA_ORIENTATION=-